MPFIDIDFNLQDDNSIDQCAADGSNQGSILRTVAGRHDPSSGGQWEFADTSLQQQRVKRLLNVRRAGRQLIQEKAKRLS